MSGLLHRIDAGQPEARSATAALDAFLKEMYWDDAFIAQFHVCSPTYAMEGGVFAPDAPWGARLLVCGVEDKNDEKRTLEFLFNGIEDFAMSSRLDLNPAVTFDGSRKRIAFNIACGEISALEVMCLERQGAGGYMEEWENANLFDEHGDFCGDKEARP